MTQPLPPDALLGDRVLEGVTRIDMSAFERAVRGTPPAGFPVLLTPPQGVAVLDVDVDTWAGTLLPREAEPFPVQAAALCTKSVRVTDSLSQAQQVFLGN